MAGVTQSSSSEEQLALETIIIGAEQGVHLLWELCEMVETSMALVSSHHLLPVVLEFLRLEYPANVVTGAGETSRHVYRLEAIFHVLPSCSYSLPLAAQCFMTMSEDNPGAVLLARTNPEFFVRLALLLQHPSQTVRACVAGK